MSQRKHIGRMSRRSSPLIARWAIAAAFFLSFVEVRASEQLRGANTLESGRVAVSLAGVHAENDGLEFRLGGSSLVRVPLTNGTTAQFFANANTDLKYDGEGDAAVLRIAWRPADGLTYVFKAGAGDYEIRVPSGSEVNVLRTGSPGRLWGAEAVWTLLNDTPVSAAVAVSLGYTRADYAFARAVTGGGLSATDHRFSLEEWQVGVGVSKRWRVFEPSAGVRVFRQAGVLTDRSTAERVRGARAGVSPYAGFRLEFKPREALAVEVAVADETVLSAGLALGF